MTQVFYSISAMQEAIGPNEKIVATMGFFDGVHLGHRSLITATKDMASRLGAKSMIITLDQHPIAVLFPERPHPLLLSSQKRKTQLLLATQPDYILVLPFSIEMSQLTSTEFISPIMEKGLVGMMLGYDNRFGKRTEGETLEMFDDNLRALGLEVNRISEFRVGDALVSSSAIRTCLTERNFAKLEALLGRPYSFLGIVREGRQIGRTINYPTANIEPYDRHLTMPPVGIYVAEVRVRDRVYPAMAYYGNSPTVSGGSEPCRLEAFLFGYSGNLYHEEVEVALRSYLREDIKFDSLDDLAIQLKKDEEATIAYYSTHKTTLKVP